MEIDVDQLEAELDKLTPEELKAQLLEAKVRQKVATKKYHNPEVAKRARDKKNARIKAQAELAKSMPATSGKHANLYEQIMAEAADEADRRLAEESVDREDAA
jgi:hypothetical protein